MHRFRCCRLPVPQCTAAAEHAAIGGCLANARPYPARYSLVILGSGGIWVGALVMGTLSVITGEYTVRTTCKRAACSILHASSNQRGECPRLPLEPIGRDRSAHRSGARPNECARGLAARAWHSDWAAQVIAHLSYLPELGDKVVQARGHSGLHRPSLVVAVYGTRQLRCLLRATCHVRPLHQRGRSRKVHVRSHARWHGILATGCTMRATCNELSRCGAGEGVRHRHYRRILGAARTGALMHLRERAFARTRTVRRLSQAIIVAVIGTVFKFEDVATATLSSCIAGAAMRPVARAHMRSTRAHERSAGARRHEPARRLAHFSVAHEPTAGKACSQRCARACAPGSLRKRVHSAGTRRIIRWRHLQEFVALGKARAEGLHAGAPRAASSARSHGPPRHAMHSCPSRLGHGGCTGARTGSAARRRIACRSARRREARLHVRPRQRCTCLRCDACAA